MHMFYSYIFIVGKQVRERDRDGERGWEREGER